MYLYASLAVTFFVRLVSAKQCTNLTVPVFITARNGIFNVPTLESNVDATTFMQNLTSNRWNYTETALEGYETVEGDYNISAKFCKPDKGAGSNPTVQVLTHGIGFDKASVTKFNVENSMS